MHHVKLPVRYLASVDADLILTDSVELFFEGDFTEGSWDIENLQDADGNPIQLTQNLYWAIQDLMENEQPDPYWDKWDN